ncbi:HTH domain-containing protein [Arthrobacter subterraneus]|uniref:HTH domain-containing protein n=1 Tax=Arthrobacter subterraneus TaxID=335973 RepID=UPI000B83A412|nr:HTH domain-containing protein [Arthrobacter subterraneus]
MSEAQEDFLCDEWDAHISRHGKQTFAAVLLAGPALDSFFDLAKSLDGAGIEILSVVQDLVTASEIAERLEVSRQAVNNWCRGTRKAASDFPEPVVLAGAHLWDWGQVVQWARTHLVVNDAVQYPSPDEVAILNGHLASARQHAKGWLTAAVDPSMARKAM